MCALPLAATQQALLARGGQVRPRLSWPQPLYHLSVAFDAGGSVGAPQPWQLAVDCQLFVGAPRKLLRSVQNACCTPRAVGRGRSAPAAACRRRAQGGGGQSACLRCSGSPRQVECQMRLQEGGIAGLRVRALS